MAQAGFALLLANIRYWTAIAPLVRHRLAHWEERAREIADPGLRELATRKLAEERFNIELAATLATLAPPSHRNDTVEAIVALQIAYDYLDLLGEQPFAAPLDGGTRTLEALVDAFRPETSLAAEHEEDPPQDGGDRYVGMLVQATKLALAKLPAREAVGAVALACAKRCAEAQRLSHASTAGDIAEMESWARRKASDTDLEWREYLAGASASVLSLHALIAAAADSRTTSKDACAIDAAYLSICALTMLDSLVDRDRDLATGALSYVDLYGGPEPMTARLAHVARHAVGKTREAPNAAHHRVTLVGIVAHYTSALGARGAFPPAITKPIRDELHPLLTPTLAVMRSWRLAKRLHAIYRSITRGRGLKGWSRELSKA